jgi:hypothetical protein
MVCGTVIYQLEWITQMVFTTLLVPQKGDLVFVMGNFNQGLN